MGSNGAYKQGLRMVGWPGLAVWRGSGAVPLVKCQSRHEQTKEQGEEIGRDKVFQTMSRASEMQYPSSMEHVPCCLTGNVRKVMRVLLHHKGQA